MFKSLLSSLAFVQTAFAQFVVQVDKDSYGAGDSIQVSWKQADPSVSKLGSQDVGQVLSCNCANSKFNCNSVKKDIDIKSDSTYTFSVSDVADMGPDGYYAIQFATHSSKDESAYTLVYTHSWFKITGGMTGTGEASNDCNIPYANNNNVPGTASSSPVWSTSYTIPSEYYQYTTTSGFMIPYTWQKGPTRTAPFQSTPGTKVTQTKTPTRRFATSSYTPFKSYFFNKRMPVSTATPGASSTAHQQVNYVSTIATTPSGRKPTRVMPTSSLQTESTSAAKHKRRVRRWAD